MKKIFTFLIIMLFASTAFAQTSFEVLVNSRATNGIMKYDEQGNYLGYFIMPSSGGLSSPEDIIFHPDGTVLVTGNNNTTIKRYNGKTGGYIGNFSTGYSLSSPSKMSIGPDSLIYVTQWGAIQNKVVRFDLQGAFVDEFTSIGAPKGLGHTWDKNRDFYIALYNNGGDGTVHRFDSTGKDKGTFINTSILQGPTNIWFDNNGDMLVEDWTTGKVLRYDSTGLYKSDFVTGMTNPEGIAFLPNGGMLIGDWGKDAVHLIDVNGNLLGYFCSGNGLTDPNCVRIRLAGTSVSKLTENEFSVTPTIGRRFKISVPASMYKNMNISIVNVTGRVTEQLSNVQPLLWDAGNYPEGHYFIVINADGQRLVKKVMVTGM